MVGHGDEEEVPVAALLDALELPRAALHRWVEHLDAFVARHGGVRRYGGLAGLTAEMRAALAVTGEGQDTR